MGELLPLLTSDEHTVCALVHDHSSGRLATEENINQVKIIRVPCYGRLLYAPISPAFPVYLQRILKQFKPDIIHIHMPNTSAFWLLLSSPAKKIPWVIHWHSDVIGASPNKMVALAYYLYQPFEFQLLKKCQLIITTSPHYQQSSTVLKAWIKKTRVIPLGLTKQQATLSDKNKDYAEQFWGESKHRLLSIGRLTYYKGHKYLIEAMQYMPESQLIIIGQGEERDSLQKLIENLKLTHHIFLTGKLSNSHLHALLKSCDIFCLPSIERTEAFGLVLLEAMYYAKPTAVSNIPGSGMTWVCQDNKTGIHTEAANSKKLGHQLQKLCNDPQCYIKLGENGKKRLENLFDLKNIADKTINLYKEMLSIAG